MLLSAGVVVASLSRAFLNFIILAGVAVPFGIARIIGTGRCAIGLHLLLAQTNLVQPAECPRGGVLGTSQMVSGEGRLSWPRGTSPSLRMANDLVGC